MKKRRYSGYFERERWLKKKLRHAEEDYAWNSSWFNKKRINYWRRKKNPW